jgi:hypothetical protein
MRRETAKAEQVTNLDILGRRSKQDRLNQFHKRTAGPTSPALWCLEVSIAVDDYTLMLVAKRK